MSTPRIESIAENIRTTVASVTVAGGYNQTLSARRPKRNDFAVAAWDDLTVLIEQAGSQWLEDTRTVATIDKRQTFVLWAFVIDSDAATAAIDTRLNQVAADLEKALMADITRGGYAQDTFIEEILPFGNADGSQSGIMLTMTVQYRTAIGNPYAAA